MCACVLSNRQQSIMLSSNSSNKINDYQPNDKYEPSKQELEEYSNLVFG